MTRHEGHYNRAMQQDLVVGEPALQVVAARLRLARCATGQHQQETDSETGNEVCALCDTVLDDYADVASVTTGSSASGQQGPDGKPYSQAAADA